MSSERRTGTAPRGEGKPWQASMLERGAGALQSHAPVQQFDIYMVGFHCAKHDPMLQMEAHHYCHQLNAEFFQCLLFDGNTRDANLVGIEYIISERLFNELPEQEQDYWHPHNYEVFSGELVAPGLPAAAEKAMLKFLVNSYGKTWHTWRTSNRNRPEEGQDLPLGPPRLMWSFNRFGEADPAMQEDRKRALGIDEAKKRAEREDLVPEAHPQRGVDALKDAFPEADGRPPGVMDAGSLDESDG